MKRLFLMVLFIFNISLLYSGNEIISIKSNYNFNDTFNRLIKILKLKNLKIFKVIDHSKGAKSVGETLRPTKLIIFGNPKIGTKLMKCSQFVGLDLPLKFLVWEDYKRQVWISYINPIYLEKRYKLVKCRKILVKINKVLKVLVKKASQ